MVTRSRRKILSSLLVKIPTFEPPSVYELHCIKKECYDGEAKVYTNTLFYRGNPMITNYKDAENYIKSEYKVISEIKTKTAYYAASRDAASRDQTDAKVKNLGQNVLQQDLENYTAQKDKITQCITKIKEHKQTKIKLVTYIRIKLSELLWFGSLHKANKELKAVAMFIALFGQKQEPSGQKQEPTQQISSSPDKSSKPEAEVPHPQGPAPSAPSFSALNPPAEPPLSQEEIDRRVRIEDEELQAVMLATFAGQELYPNIGEGVQVQEVFIEPDIDIDEVENEEEDKELRRALRESAEFERKRQLKAQQDQGKISVGNNPASVSEASPPLGAALRAGASKEELARREEEDLQKAIAASEQLAREKLEEQRKQEKIFAEQAQANKAKKQEKLAKKQAAYEKLATKAQGIKPEEKPKPPEPPKDASQGVSQPQQPEPKSKAQPIKISSLNDSQPQPKPFELADTVPGLEKQRVVLLQLQNDKKNEKHKEKLDKILKQIDDKIQLLGLATPQPGTPVIPSAPVGEPPSASLASPVDLLNLSEISIKPSPGSEIPKPKVEDPRPKRTSASPGEDDADISL